MSSTRSFKSPGVFASDASTVIPPTPIAGAAYRDAVSGTDDVENGWRYGTRVDSKDWNQIMFLITSMMGVMDTQGILGWSGDVDYTGPCITFGSDDQLYAKTSLASGPNNGGAKDPISNPTYWELFSSKFGASVGDIKAVATPAAPSGWLECNGAAVSRATYAALFSAIGTTFGAGNGTTTFNVPDLRGEFVRGWDNGRGVDPARVRGSSQVGTSITGDNGLLPAVHGIGNVGTINGDPADGTIRDIYNLGGAVVLSDATTFWRTTRPRNVAFLHVIKT